jgi:hypothetical protein
MKKTAYLRIATLSLCGGLLLACPHQAPSTTAQPAQDVAANGPAPGPYEGQTVLGVVERLEHKAHEEWLSDGDVWVTDVVAFAIVIPEKERLGTLLLAHVDGHPKIGDRPLLLGDVVSFVLPVNWRNRDLSFEELEGIRFHS